MSVDSELALRSQAGKQYSPIKGLEIENFKFRSMPGTTSYQRRQVEQRFIDAHGGINCVRCLRPLINKINAIRKP